MARCRFAAAAAILKAQTIKIAILINKAGGIDIGGKRMRIELVRATYTAATYDAIHLLKSSIEQQKTANAAKLVPALEKREHVGSRR